MVVANDKDRTLMVLRHSPESNYRPNRGLPPTIRGEFGIYTVGEAATGAGFFRK